MLLIFILSNIIFTANKFEDGLLDSEIIENYQSEQERSIKYNASTSQKNISGINSDITFYDKFANNSSTDENTDTFTTDEDTDISSIDDYADISSIDEYVDTEFLLSKGINLLNNEKDRNFEKIDSCISKNKKRDEINVSLLSESNNMKISFTKGQNSKDLISQNKIDIVNQAKYKIKKEKYKRKFLKNFKKSINCLNCQNISKINEILVELIKIYENYIYQMDVIKDSYCTSERENQFYQENLGIVIEKLKRNSLDLYNIHNSWLLNDSGELEYFEINYCKKHEYILKLEKKFNKFFPDDNKEFDTTKKYEFNEKQKKSGEILN